MARPRTFDESDALDAAVACFWRRGLGATSVRDLATEMGLNCPSLYNTFGDKRAVFAQALERYATRFLRERIQRLEQQHSPKAAIGAYFEELIARSLADPDQRGCLIINTALEVAADDAELRPVICGYLAEIERFFRDRLQRARASGEIPATLEPDDTARLFLGLVLGIRVVARVKPERALLEGMAQPALALLDLPDTGNAKGTT
jgi:TetR/AcrR family transcriptional regulator, transcriptional repressor for nem operon